MINRNTSQSQQALELKHMKFIRNQFIRNLVLDNGRVATWSEGLTAEQNIDGSSRTLGS